MFLYLQAMSILHVRNVPEEIYVALSERARRSHRSLSAEVIALLGQALERGERSVGEILAAIEARRKFQPAAAGAPSSLELLREDRDA
jgi:plasmid stability protein